MKVPFTNEWGHKYEIWFERHYYVDQNRLAVEMMCADPEEEDYFEEPYAMLTVNLPNTPLDGEDKAFFDLNNCGQYMFSWLKQKGILEDTMRVGFSGMCVYPLVKFDMDLINKIDGKGEVEELPDLEWTYTRLGKYAVTDAFGDDCILYTYKIEKKGQTLFIASFDDEPDENTYDYCDWEAGSEEEIREWAESYSKGE